MSGVRRGIWLFPNRDAGELVDAVVAAEELGLDEVWIADEGVARDPMPVLAAAAGLTTSIRLATGITSPLLRHPGALGSTIATLDELSGGRAVLGLGLGGALTLDPFGIVPERPVAVLRDAIVLARDVINARASDRYRPPDHAMPARDVPIWVGARGPQLVRTAARFADGIFVSGCSAAQHDEISGHAAAVGGTRFALYQSGAARPTSDSERDWDAAQALLGAELARLRPAAVGLNLVEAVHDAERPLAPLVERAATLLRSL